MATILEMILSAPPIQISSLISSESLPAVVSPSPEESPDLHTMDPEEAHAPTPERSEAEPVEDLLSSCTNSPRPVAAVSPTPSIVELPMEAEMENMNVSEEDSYENEHILQVMDLLNFTVVPRKPRSIYDTALPAGEYMPKMVYIEEKKAFFEMLRLRNKEIVRAQMEKLDAVNQAQEKERKMKHLVKIITELHDLYAQLVQSLVLLLMKGQRHEVIVGDSQRPFLTLGPFQDGQELDNLVSMLSGLSNQLNNGFQNISKLRQVLYETVQYLCDKGESVVASPQSPSNVADAASAGMMEADVGGQDDYSNLVGGLNEQEMGFISEENLNTSTYTIDQQCSIPFSNAPSTVYDDDTDCPFTITSVQSYNDYDTTATFPTSSVEEEDVIFLSDSEPTPPSDMSQPQPVATNSGDGNLSVVNSESDTQQPTLADCHNLFTLIEYPKQASVRGTPKNHGFDMEKCNASSGMCGGESLPGWTCLCGQTFSALSLIKYHVRQFNAKWKFMCNICLKKYPVFNIFKLHLLRKHKIVYTGSNKCSLCTQSFQTSGELFLHLKNKHGKKIPTEVAQMASSANCDVSDDLSTCIQDSSSTYSVTIPSSFSPDPTTNSVLIVNGTRCSCGLEFESKEALLSHINAEVKANGQHFQCSLCVEKFNHVCSLKNHYVDKHGIQYQCYQERQYGCSSCDSMFGSNEDLETHIGSEHRFELEPSTSLELDQGTLSGLLNDDGVTNTTDRENSITFYNNPMEPNISDNHEDSVFSEEPLVLSIDDEIS